MEKLYDDIIPDIRSWVGRQHMFFVASAPLAGTADRGRRRRPTAIRGPGAKVAHSIDRHIHALLAIRFR